MKLTENSSRRFGWLVAALTMLILAACSKTTAPALPPSEPELSGPVTSGQAPIIRATGKQGIPGQYIVVFKNSVRDAPSLANALIRAHGGNRLHVYRHTIKGFAVSNLPTQALEALRNNPNVAYIEQDGLVFMDATEQPSATWGLDRIDQRDLPLNTTYSYSQDGTDVNVYVIDSGILYAHQEFGGRASLGIDFVGDGVAQAAGDCDGHGTHVAGTIGGNTYGVAKRVNLISVRVFDCSGSGISVAREIAAIDWVTANHVKPAVTNMSLGGIGLFQSEIDAVTASVNAGVTYAIAAGNDNGYNACNVGPAGVPAAITVASSMSSDARSGFSNIGPCVDIFAPGSAITSAWHTSDTATNTINGTSMATPHVAGVAALVLDDRPTATPAMVANAIVSNASSNKLTNVGTGSPNLLLHSLISLINTAPIASHGGSYSANEGSALAFDGSSSSDTDGDILTYSWSFGDGGTGSGAAPSHTYADNGSYTVTLSVSDGLATTTATTTATIANVAPSVNAGPDATITSGDTFSFSGAFNDAGVNDAPWSYSINWGTGTPTTGSSNSQAAPITASRQYLPAGSYTVNLSVTDEDSGTGQDALTLTVRRLEVDINIRPGSNTNPVSLSDRGLLPVAVLTTPTFNATRVNPATVILGDETGSDTQVARQRNGKPYAFREDVDGDGDSDLLLMFNVPALVANGDLATSTTQLLLLGDLNSGVQIRGSNSVTVVP